MDFKIVTDPSRNCHISVTGATVTGFTISVCHGYLTITGFTSALEFTVSTKVGGAVQRKFCATPDIGGVRSRPKLSQITSEHRELNFSQTHWKS